jgi:hypothetical protein
MQISWATVIPLFVLALVLSTTGWVLATRRDADASILDVSAGVIAAGGALLIIGTGALGLTAALIAIVAAGASLALFRIAVTRGASQD